MESRKARRAEPGRGQPRRLLARAPEPGGSACPPGDGSSLAGLYLIGALPVEQTRSYEGHLLHCPSCQTDCDQIAPAVDALATLPAGEAVVLAELSSPTGEGRAPGPQRPQLQ
ncbi:hypothetical protein AB0B66_30250 [Catellatospora sp. NPDC049111]|uniref:hypothetical protein n=1 Tax=Catellatospora sp. NPDC049111 TaxID=3155271 RepID=UPI0033EE8628